MSKAHKKTNVSPIVKNEPEGHFFSSQLLSRIEDMERRFENMFSGGWSLPHLWGKHEEHLPMPFEGRTPKVDVVDRDDDILVKAELPGVKKEDIEVSMSESALTIRGSTHAETKEEKGDYFRSEISSGSFCRTIGLPGEVDVDHCDAKFKDGLLELTIPKVEKSRKRNIEIK